VADKNVQLPDGSVVAFPGDMSDDAISGVIRNHLQKQNQQQFVSGLAQRAGLPQPTTNPTQTLIGPQEPMDIGGEASFPQGEPGNRIGPTEIGAAAIIASPVLLGGLSAALPGLLAHPIAGPLIRTAIKAAVGAGAGKLVGGKAGAAIGGIAGSLAK
jgi:hypothetical protein